MAGRVEEESEVEKRSYGVDCFGAGRGVANLRSGLGRGQAVTDGATRLSDPITSPITVPPVLKRQVCSFGSVIYSHFERIYLPVDFGGFYFNSTFNP